MTSNEQRGLDAGTVAPSPQMRGDGEAAIIECLAAGKPFVFDPATNFLHADDGTVEYGIRYVPDDRQPAPGDQVVGGNTLRELLALIEKMPKYDRGFSWERWNYRGVEEIRAYGENAAILKFILDNTNEVATALRASLSTAIPEKQP